MADITIPQLNAATSVSGTDVMVISQAGVTKKVEVDKLTEKVLSSSVDILHMNPTTVQTLANIGELAFNPDTQTLEVKCSADVTLSIGQENYIRGKNAESSTILNGTVVYVSGGQGANSLIKRAGNADGTAERVIGIATQDIGANNIGFITTSGVVNKLDTSAYADGDLLWLGTNGAMTNVKPDTSVDQICIGVVLRSHATQGSLLVAVKDDWRGQVAQLRSDIETLQRIQTSHWNKNLFNPNDENFDDGMFLGHDGQLNVNPLTLVTGFIPFSKAMGSLQSSVNGSKNVSGGYIWLYDKDFNKVNGYAANTSVRGCATWENNVAFVRFSITKGDNIQVERGNVVTEYVPYNKYVANECIDNKAQLDSILIKNGIQNSVATLSSGAYLFIQNNTPKNIHRNNLAVMTAKVTSFSGGFRFAKGSGADNGANYFDVDETNITWTQFKDGATTVKGTFAHSLSFSEFVKMCLIECNGTLRIVLQTLSGTFVQMIDNFGTIFNGQVYVKSNGTFTDVKVAWSNDYLRKSVWMFGDSYFGMDTEQRELYWLKEWESLDVLVDNMAGINSEKSYEELLRCLSFGTPKKLVWCLGMNDGSDSNEESPTVYWSHYIELVEEICKEKNIELILATIPNVPSVNNEGKNKWVRESGYRYIDVASAVGANVFESGVATWHGENGGTQYLEGSSNQNNRIHPTIVGAKAIATQFLVDFPDIRG